jgi:transposase
VLDRHDLTEEEWARLEPLLPDRTPLRAGLPGKMGHTGVNDRP